MLIEIYTLSFKQMRVKCRLRKCGHFVSASMCFKERLVKYDIACRCRQITSTREQLLDTLYPWWRHQMETFSALLAICAGNSPVTGEFPEQRPVTRSFDVFFDLRLNKLLSKQSWGWWFETLSRPLWCHCNAACLWQKTDWYMGESDHSRTGPLFTKR